MRTRVTTPVNLFVSCEAGYCHTSYATVRFSRRSLLHRVNQSACLFHTVCVSGEVNGTFSCGPVFCVYVSAPCPSLFLLFLLFICSFKSHFALIFLLYLYLYLVFFFVRTIGHDRTSRSSGSHPRFVIGRSVIQIFVQILLSLCAFVHVCSPQANSGSCHITHYRFLPYPLQFSSN
jgi:hypothetical protein